jgi:tetratricopeptide (TPR) repeat protein
LLAYYSGDNDLMLDQWSKSLSISHEPLQTVIDLASQKVSVIKIAQELVPTNRLDRIIDLLQRRRPQGSNHFNDKEVAEVAQYIRTCDRFEPFRRHATLASLEEMIGRVDEAIDHWEKAMKMQPMDPKVRLRFAESLRRAERYDDALDQATLGQHLFPSDKRFERLAGSIRSDITLQR